MAFAGNPGNFLPNAPNHFPKFSFVWAQELKVQKMAIFRRCLEIAGKAKYGGKFIEAKPKNLVKFSETAVITRRNENTQTP